MQKGPNVDVVLEEALGLASRNSLYNTMQNVLDQMGTHPFHSVLFSMYLCSCDCRIGV